MVKGMATDPRKTLTLKSPEFDAEFRALLNKAARKRGMTQAAFAAEVLAEAARKVLSGEAEEAPPPAIIPPEIIARQEATEAALTRLAAQVEALSAAQKRSLWARIWRKGKN